MDHELKQFLEFVVGSFLVLFLVTSFFAFVFGGMTAIREKECKYKSILSYHSARILACELFKERW